MPKCFVCSWFYPDPDWDKRMLIDNKLEYICDKCNDEMEDEQSAFNIAEP